MEEVDYRIINPGEEPSLSPDVSAMRKYTSRMLNAAIEQTKNAAWISSFQSPLESEIDRAREEGYHEGFVDGKLAWRTAELVNAIKQEEMFLSRKRVGLNLFRLQRCTRAHPIGRDLEKRYLYYFWGDDEETVLRVWCYDEADGSWGERHSAKTTWLLLMMGNSKTGRYDGKEAITGLAKAALENKDEFTFKNLCRVMDSCTRRLRWVEIRKKNKKKN